MGRIAVDTNDLRSTASALRSAAGVYQEISLVVGGTVETSSLPVSMRSRVLAFETQITGEARHVAGVVGGQSVDLASRAARFDGVGGGAGLSVRQALSAPGASFFSRLGGAANRILGNAFFQTAFSVATGGISKARTPWRIVNVVNGALRHADARAMKFLASHGVRPGVFRTGPLTFKNILSGGRGPITGRIIGRANLVTSAIFNTFDAIDTYRRTPGSSTTKVVSGAGGFVFPQILDTFAPPLGILNHLSGNPAGHAPEVLAVTGESLVRFISGDPNWDRDQIAVGQQAARGELGPLFSAADYVGYHVAGNAVTFFANGGSAMLDTITGDQGSGAIFHDMVRDGDYGPVLQQMQKATDAAVDTGYQAVEKGLQRASDVTSDLKDGGRGLLRGASGLLGRL